MHKKFIPNNITSEPNGRHVFVSGHLFQQPVLLVNAYAPNWDDETFTNKLLSSLPSLDTHKLILGGDVNTLLIQYWTDPVPNEWPPLK